jgi:hypothetical protein
MEIIFLYRGVSLDLYNANNGELIPKGTSFIQGLILDTELAILDSGIQLGRTENN